LILAELFIYSKVPSRIADNIVLKTPSSGIAIVLILIITGIISAFVENVATVMVMAPVALALCAKLKMNPARFMVGLAVMSNLQGTATLVGDPPSMIFASFANYGFNDFFIYDGRLSIFFIVQVGMLAGAVFFFILFSKENKMKINVEKGPVLSSIPSALLIIMIVALAVISFFHRGISLLAGLVVMGLGIAGIFWYAFIRKEGLGASFSLVKKLDWETILFLIGIFIVIGALSETGLLEDLVDLLAGMVGGNVLLGFISVIAVSVAVSGFVDNVPYIIAMLPVFSSLSERLGLKPELYMFALLVGSCLGGNVTPFGASANIAAIGILKKEGVTLSFSDWVKIGLPFTIITTAAAAIFLWFLWR
jgi:Na+/H+ antiporter NhaD/arsenite permease-like protein